jgi:hypothetical protein
MNKIFKVLPNFSVMIEVNEYYVNNYSGIIKCYCEEVSNTEYVATFRITPESFWRGMNVTLGRDIDFISILKNNSLDEIPPNVLNDLEKFKSKFGIVTLIGDDCLSVRESDILEEIKSNTELSKSIYHTDGSLIFIKDIDIPDFSRVLENDIGVPIKIHKPEIKTFLMKDGGRTFVNKAKDPFSAFKSLYNNHPKINEESLRAGLKDKEKEITQEDIDKYLKNLFELGAKGVEIIPIPYFVINQSCYF